MGKIKFCAPINLKKIFENKNLAETRAFHMFCKFLGWHLKSREPVHILRAEI